MTARDIAQHSKHTVNNYSGKWKWGADGAENVTEPTFWGPGRPTLRRRQSCVAYKFQAPAAAAATEGAGQKQGAGGASSVPLWSDENCVTQHNFTFVCTAPL